MEAIKMSSQYVLISDYFSFSSESTQRNLRSIPEGPEKEDQSCSPLCFADLRENTPHRYVKLSNGGPNFLGSYVTNCSTSFISHLEVDPASKMKEFLVLKLLSRDWMGKRLLVKRKNDS